jgi:hypothetical protein
MTGTGTEPRATGACLCGGVRIEIRGDLRPVIACHCDECRRWSGGFWSATAAREADLTIRESGSLRWYRSSDKARRGYCADCGTSLFWKHDERSYLAIAAGALDKPTGLTLAAHIFMAEAGDYYRICDNLPSSQDGRHAVPFPTP